VTLRGACLKGPLIGRQGTVLRRDDLMVNLRPADRHSDVQRPDEVLRHLLAQDTDPESAAQILLTKAAAE
jgi:hypothetical protein